MAEDFGPYSRIILGFGAQGDLGPLTMYRSKRKKMVFFLRAPPLNPPSQTQEYMRESYRIAARKWRAAGLPVRTEWNTAARRAHLGISGYCLWVWWLRGRDEASLQTIERQSGISLARPT